MISDYEHGANRERARCMMTLARLAHYWEGEGDVAATVLALADALSEGLDSATSHRRALEILAESAKQ